jgi:hypothetical protein
MLPASTPVVDPPGPSLAQAEQLLQEVSGLFSIPPVHVKTDENVETDEDVKTVERVLTAMANWMPEEQDGSEALAVSWIERIYSVRHHELAHSYS